MLFTPKETPTLTQGGGLFCVVQSTYLAVPAQHGQQASALCYLPFLTTPTFLSAIRRSASVSQKERMYADLS